MMEAEDHNEEMHIARTDSKMLKAHNARLLGYLGELEWIPEYEIDGLQHSYCPVCRAPKALGHKPKCWLGKELK